MLELEGEVPEALPLTRRPVASPEVAVIGWRPELALAFARWPGQIRTGQVDSGAVSLVTLAGSPVISLNNVEVVGSVGPTGDVIGVDRIIAALAAAGLPAPLE